MNERRSTPLYVLPVIALLVLTSAVPAGAAVFQVTKTADTLDGAARRRRPLSPGWPLPRDRHLENRQ